MAYEVKGAPFRYKGVQNVENCNTSVEVMQKAGLDWEVAKCRMFANMPIENSNEIEESDDCYIERSTSGDRMLKVCENAYGIYRTDYNIPLGLVKERYEPVQNIDAFKFFDDAIGKNSAIWQTAGAFGYGERIFVSAKLPDNILVHGDPVENYLVFTNSHDGSSGVKILFTPIRVICQNTLNSAIKTSKNFISFRHTSSVHKNIDIACELLGICKKQTEELSEIYNYMNTIKLKDEDAFDIMGKVVLTEGELNKLKETNHTVKQVAERYYFAMTDADISMQKVNILSAMADYYDKGPGQKEIKGTGWGVYNTISGYYSNIDNTSGLKRLDTLLYGDRSRKISLAGDLILNAA